MGLIYINFSVCKADSQNKGIAIFIIEAEYFVSLNTRKRQ